MMISIIVPCYNEENNVKPLVRRFFYLKKKMPIELELILVNNGSSDGTENEIKKYADRYSWIHPVKVVENQGYGFGILSGLEKANGDYLGWIHADLQAAPEVFLKMAEKLNSIDEDFLFKGSRRQRPFMDTLFTIGMSLYETIYLRVPLWDINAQPTLMTRAFYERIADGAPYDFSLDLYVYFRAKQERIAMRRFISIQQNREHGASSWNTGMAARVKLIKRVVSYSRQLKKGDRDGG